LISRDIRLEPGQCVEKMIVAVNISRVDAQRQPHIHAYIGWELKLKIRRHYANHINRIAVKRNTLVG